MALYMSLFEIWYNYFSKSCYQGIQEASWNLHTQSWFRSEIPNNGVRFGYDPKSNDLKVVWFIRLSSYVYSPTRVEVYTLGTDSWRELKRKDLRGVEDSFLLLLLSLIVKTSMELVIRYRHVLLTRSADSSSPRLTWVMSSSKKISMPNYTISKVFRLMVFNESLEMVMHNLIGGSYSLVIWVLKFNGRNMDEIMTEDKNGFVCWHNLVTLEIRNLHLPVERHRVKFAIVNYMSSLEDEISLIQHITIWPKYKCISIFVFCQCRK